MKAKGVMHFPPILKLAASIALAAAFACGPALGEEVTLTSRGGGLTLKGELISSGSGSFVVKSGFGLVTVQSSNFDCVGPACPAASAGAVAIHGSNTIGAQLMPDTIERFGEKEGYTLEKIVGADPEQVAYKLYSSDGKEAGFIELESHGSNTAPVDLREGKAQIGAMSRPIKPEEVKAITASGFELQTHVFALDGIVILVSPQNPIRALTLDQIAKIFAGSIKDWSEVGGSPGRIKLYARDANSGTYDTFDHLVLKPRNLKLSQEAKRLESNPELSDDIAGDPEAIGFAGFAYVRNAKALAISSDCGIVSEPQVFSVKTEEYPLSRRLFLHSTRAISPLGVRLLDYALSDAAQETISAAGFVNQRIELQTFEQESTRLTPALLVPDKEFQYTHMRELVNDLKNARRLSVNFRFQKNSAVLDDKARQDIPRTANFLKSDGAHFKEILLAGFTDSTGTPDGNRAVALARAISFKKALAAAGIDIHRIVAKSYGSLLPAGCNSTEAGRDKNRRVEIWVKE